MNKIQHRGGLRPNAGRKPKGTAPRSATISVRVTVTARHIIEQTAASQGISISTLIESYAQELSNKLSQESGGF